MVLTFVIISFFSILNSSIGKDLNNIKLIAFKNGINRWLLFGCYNSIRKGLNWTNNYAFFLLSFFTFFSFITYIVLIELFNIKVLITASRVEFIIFFFIIVFGFKTKKQFVNDLKDILKKAFGLYMVMALLLNLIFLISINFQITETSIKELVRNNLILFAVYSSLNVALFIIYKLFPQLITLFLSISFIYMAKQIILKDKSDPLAGMFRYLSYLTAFMGVIQFIVTVYFIK